MRKTATAAAAAAATFVVSTLLAPAGAHAACDPGKPGSQLTGAEAQEGYECIAGKLHDGYKKGGKGWIDPSYVNDYRSWTKASTIPAAPGVHGDRFLLTWVNKTGAAEYMKYAENPDIPAGTLIAKESFSVSNGGKVVPGPLFLMEKAAEGKSPETDDWYYMMVAPNGSPVAVDVVSACSACHQGGFGHQGGLGYPVEEARVK
jgi:hypothetical protein